MSQFRVEVTILSRNGETPHTLEALVDTGAAYSLVPRPLIEFLGYRSVRTQRVILADGRFEEWPVSHVDVECQGRRTVTPVLMSAPGAPVLLGATTLEELGLGVDPLNRRLIPVDLYPAPVLLPHDTRNNRRGCSTFLSMRSPRSSRPDGTLTGSRVLFDMASEDPGVSDGLTVRTSVDRLPTKTRGKLPGA